MKAAGLSWVTTGVLKESRNIDYARFRPGSPANRKGRRASGIIKHVTGVHTGNGVKALNLVKELPSPDVKKTFPSTLLSIVKRFFAILKVPGQCDVDQLIRQQYERAGETAGTDRVAGTDAGTDRVEGQ